MRWRIQPLASTKRHMSGPATGLTRSRPESECSPLDAYPVASSLPAHRWSPRQRWPSAPQWTRLVSNNRGAPALRLNILPRALHGLQRRSFPPLDFLILARGNGTYLLRIRRRRQPVARLYFELAGFRSRKKAAPVPIRSQTSSRASGSTSRNPQLGDKPPRIACLLFSIACRECLQAHRTRPYAMKTKGTGFIPSQRANRRNAPSPTHQPAKRLRPNWLRPFLQTQVNKQLICF